MKVCLAVLVLFKFLKVEETMVDLESELINMTVSLRKIRVEGKEIKQRIQKEQKHKQSRGFGCK